MIQLILRLVFFTFILSSGIILNVFIAVVSYRTWLGDGFRRPQGLLLFSIGLTSALFEGYQLFMDLSYYIWTEDFISVNICMVFIHCLFTSCIFFSVCQISWLCSFYCIKLVSFQHRIIGVLKSKLSSILPWIMASTLVISLIVFVLWFGPIFIQVPTDDVDSSTFCRRINDTFSVYIKNVNNGMSFIITLPFCLILGSLSCTAITLVWRVQGTLSLDRSHLEAQIDAAKTMILLLVLNTSFYMSFLFLHWDIVTSPWSWLCIMIYYLFWPLQALTLIFRTKKLHKSFMRCLCRKSL